ncbi:MAG: ATP-binding protein [Gammaproteobacteria bacterium]
MSLDISPSTVIVVDAGAAGAASARAALAGADFECEECPQTAALPALLRARPAHFDAVLLGVDHAPGDALEVLLEMKSDRLLRGIPVVMTGAGPVEDAVCAGIRAGAHYFVTKPFTADLLVSVLRAAIEGRREYVDLERELERTLESVVLLRHAEFEFRTVEEASSLAGLLAKMAPEPVRTVTGLWELMLNAIEHGNLGITYAEKAALLEDGSWAQEIERRLESPPWCTRHARVRVTCDEREVRYRITDQGEGFVPDRYLDFEMERLCHAHGRGIALARRVSFDEVRYYSGGNDVEASIRRTIAPEQQPARDRGDESPRSPASTAGAMNAADSTAG